MPRHSQLNDAVFVSHMLDHAAKVFAEGDYSRTATEKLRDPSGRFSAARYFNYFGTKEGILQALFHRFWQAMYERAVEATKDAVDPLERLRRMVHASVDVFKTNEHLFRVTSVNCYPAGTPLRVPGAEFHGLYKTQVLRAIVEATKGCPLERRPKPHVVYELIVGATEKLLNEYYLNDHDDHEPKRRRKVTLREIEQHLEQLCLSFFGNALGKS